MVDLSTLKHMSATCRDLRDASTSRLWERVTISVDYSDFRRWLHSRTMSRKILFIIDPQRSRHVRRLALRVSCIRRYVIGATPPSWVSSFLKSLRVALVPLAHITHFTIAVADPEDTNGVLGMLNGHLTKSRVDVLNVDSPIDDDYTPGVPQTFWSEHPHIHSLNLEWRDMDRWKQGPLIQSAQHPMNLEYLVSFHDADLNIISGRPVLGVAFTYSGGLVMPIVNQLRSSIGPLRSLKFTHGTLPDTPRDAQMFEALSYLDNLEEIEVSTSTMATGSEMACFRHLSRLPYLTTLYWHRTPASDLWGPAGAGCQPDLEISLTYVLTKMSSDKFQSLSYVAFGDPVVGRPALCRNQMNLNGDTIWSEWRRTMDSPFKVSKHLVNLQRQPPVI